MKKKILIVDDEIDLLMLMEHIFLSTGLYDVVTASDGLMGQKKAVDEKPDLIFLDYIMGGVMGDEVLKFIRKEPALDQTAVVIMSGLGGAVYFNDEDGQGSPGDGAPESFLGTASSISFPQDVIRSCGVSAVLPKPFSRDKLLRVTEKIFSGQADEGGPGFNKSVLMF